MAEEKKERSGEVAPRMTQEEAEAFFGVLFYGEHHVPSKIKDLGSGYWQVTWAYPSGGDLGTYDYDFLTRAVFLAHDQAVRFSVVSLRGGKLGLRVAKRLRATGEWSTEHPSLQTAVATWREKHPAPEAEGT